MVGVGVTVRTDVLVAFAVAVNVFDGVALGNLVLVGSGVAVGIGVLEGTGVRVAVGRGVLEGNAVFVGGTEVGEETTGVFVTLFWEVLVEIGVVVCVPIDVVEGVVLNTAVRGVVRDGVEDVPTIN